MAPKKINTFRSRDIPVSERDRQPQERPSSVQGGIYSVSRSDTGISLCDPANERLIAGVDEAGRGPLAGPVIAAAVILHPERPVAGLADSKTLSPKARERLSQEICRQAHGWAIGRAEAEEIDRLNILRASLLAMRRAVLSLPMEPQEVWVDGKHCPELSYSIKAIIKGDALVPAISAASILAKVVRDQEMVELDQKYPGYGFAIHKGYPTRAHLEALRSLGVSPIHRRSFAPVRNYSPIVSQADQGMPCKAESGEKAEFTR